MKKLFFVWVCGLFFLASCKQEKLDGDKAKLVGRWQWEYTWVQNKGEIEDIDTLYAPDYSNVYEIEFIEKGIMNWYKNDKSTLHKDIKFDLVECNFPNPFGNCTYYINDKNFYFKLLLKQDQPSILSMRTDRGGIFFPDLTIPEDKIYQHCFIKIE